MGHLIEVDNVRLVSGYVLEAKGLREKTTVKTAESLAIQIRETLKNLSSGSSERWRGLSADY